MAEDEPPPRKKSRFFSGSKSKFRSMLKKKKRVEDDEHNCDSDSSDGIGNENSYVSAAKFVKFLPIGRGTTFDLTDRTANELDLPVGQPHNQENGGKVGSATRNGVARDKRREGVYIERASNNSTTPAQSPLYAVAGGVNGDVRNHALNKSEPVNSLCTAPGTSVDYQDTQHKRLSMGESTIVHATQYEQNQTGTKQSQRKSAIKHKLLDSGTHPCGHMIQSSLGQLGAAAYVNGFIRNSYDPFAALPKPNASLGRPLNSATSRQPDIRATWLENSKRTPFAMPVRTPIPSRDEKDDQPPTHESHSDNIAQQESRDKVDMHGYHENKNSSSELLLGQPVSNTTFDLDRDGTGALLSPHLRGMLIRGQNGLPVHALNQQSRFTTPANLNTSPKRLEKAIAISALNLKRKRDNPLAAPPAYIYMHNGDPQFNVFANGFLMYPELCFNLASLMPLADLINLYAISKDFHTIIDTRFTTVCLTQALRKAPQSAQTFHFRSYAQFCRTDPSARIEHPDPQKAALQIPRKIPSFRWVGFVLHREKVVHEIVTIFAERGCPLPARCTLALKRMWMLMDIPDNARRIATIHNHRLFTDLDLYFIMCFIVKLDMVANDPLSIEYRNGLRKLLLSQQGGLDVLLKVLKREMWQKKSDYMVAWIRTSMHIGTLNHQQLQEMDVRSVFGVPVSQVGLGKYEYWGLRGTHSTLTGRKRQCIMRPDQLVVREAIRREIRFGKHYLKCMLYGYVRPDTLEDYEPRKYGRRIAEWDDEDYDLRSSVGGIRALSVEDGGDSFLDVEIKGYGSPWTIVKEGVGRQEQALRSAQTDFVERLYAVSEQERSQKAF